LPGDKKSPNSVAHGEATGCGVGFWSLFFVFPSGFHELEGYCRRNWKMLTIAQEITTKWRREWDEVIG